MAWPQNAQNNTIKDHNHAFEFSAQERKTVRTAHMRLENESCGWTQIPVSSVYSSTVQVLKLKMLFETIKFALFFVGPTLQCMKREPAVRRPFHARNSGVI